MFKFLSDNENDTIFTNEQLEKTIAYYHNSVMNDSKLCNKQLSSNDIKMYSIVKSFSSKYTNSFIEKWFYEAKDSFVDSKIRHVDRCWFKLVEKMIIDYLDKGEPTFYINTILRIVDKILQEFSSEKLQDFCITYLLCGIYSFKFKYLISDCDYDAYHYRDFDEFQVNYKKRMFVFFNQENLKSIVESNISRCNKELKDSNQDEDINVELQFLESVNEILELGLHKELSI